MNKKEDCLEIEAENVTTTKNARLPLPKMYVHLRIVMDQIADSISQVKKKIDETENKLTWIWRGVPWDQNDIDDPERLDRHQLAINESERRLSHLDILDRSLKRLEYRQAQTASKIDTYKEYVPTQLYETPDGVCLLVNKKRNLRIYESLEDLTKVEIQLKVKSNPATLNFNEYEALQESLSEYSTRIKLIEKHFEAKVDKIHFNDNIPILVAKYKCSSGTISDFYAVFYKEGDYIPEELQ